MQAYILQGFDQKNVIFQESILSVGLQLGPGTSYDLQNLPQDVK